MASDDEEIDDTKWSDWEEEEGGEGGLFENGRFVPLCDPTTSFATAEEAFAHDANKHSFDIKGVVKSLGLGFYDCMKLVNFVRNRVSQGEQVSHTQLADESESSWRDEQYLIPFMENDRLLMELDEALELDLHEGEAEAEEHGATKTASSLDSEALQEENAQLKKTVQQLKENLSIAGKFFEQDGGASSAEMDKASATKQKNVKIDKSYFDSYAGFGIHKEMLSDRPRMVAYRSAIELNASSLMKDKEVLDVGCGTGILSMISARAGAKHVYAVDGSPDIAAVAQDIVEENKLAQAIDVRSGRIESKGTLPEDYKCDVIVSEWMGYCLLYESMLFSVLDARDKYLKKGGCVLPDIAQIFIAGCDESAITLSFWDDVEGFSMRSVGKKLLEKELQSKAHVMDVKGDSIITSRALVKEFDLCTMAADDAKFFSQEFDLTLQTSEESDHQKQKNVYALTIWFDTLFSKQHCTQEVVLTTSPTEDKTHWAQTLLVLPQPLALTSEKKTLECRLTLKQHSDDYRGLHLVLEYGHAKKGDNTYPHVAQYELV